MKTEGISVFRSQMFSHVFHFLLTAGKGCLFPFLTLYFRQIGLSAFQVGIVLSSKALVCVLIAPLWTTCAWWSNKKRLVLMSSISILLLSNMFLTLIPTSEKSALMYCCASENCTLINDLGVTKPGENGKTASDLVNTTVAPQITFTSPVTKPNMDKPDTNTIASDITKDSSLVKAIIPTISSPVPTVSSPVSSRVRTRTVPSRKETVVSRTSLVPRTTTVTTLKNSKTSPRHNSKVVDQLLAVMSVKELDILRNMGFTRDKLIQLSNEDLSSLIKIVAGSENGDDVTSREKREILTSTLGDLHSKLSWLQERLQQYKYATFIAVFVVIIVGEMFAAPIDKISDKAWFEFLDDLDILEKYGQQKVWASFGMVLIPVVVTVIVDSTPCLLSNNVSHFFIHFYSFAALVALALVAAFFYPIATTRKKIHMSQGLVKGCKILCGDVHAFSYSITALVVGMLYAALTNFLFWAVQDAGGQEVIMGGAVGLAAAMEMFMYLMQRWLIKALGPAGAIIISLFCLAARFVVYSFMWVPWVVLIGELFHATSYTLMWAAIQSYQDFRINPFAMNRTALSVANFLHYGLGWAVGSILSGLVYDLFGGTTILYQGCAVVAVVWAVVFGVLQKCKTKKTVAKAQYARLVDDEDWSDGSPDYDDDWLETALTIHR